MSILSASILGPLQYLRSKPNALLFRPTPELKQVTSTLPAGGAGVHGAAFGTEDLATFLLPRILRAASCLEAALLSSTEPTDDREDVQAQLWRDRQALKLKLEDLLFTIVRVLAESAVRVEWQSRQSAVPGGLGKAREMMTEMVKRSKSVV